MKTTRDDQTISGPSSTESSSLVRLASPLEQGRAAWKREHVAVVLGVHVLAMLALVPWLFSWTGVAVGFAGIFCFGTLGINIGYHRLLTHRSFKCAKWLEYTFALLGVCCLQGATIRWVAMHRMHHQFSDKEEDPHSPLVSFLWAHLEWMLTEQKNRSWLVTYDKYAPDLIRDYFYLALDRKGTWFFVWAAHTVMFFVAGFGVGTLALGGSLVGGLQFGSSLLVWGAIVRTVAVWHITWSVNSLSHVSGYRSYETADQSRNNWFVSLISMGEGWHNNHHAEPNSAAAGHRWWEIDPAFSVIRALSLVGLVQDIVPVRGHIPRVQAKPVERLLAIIDTDGNRKEVRFDEATPDDHSRSLPTDDQDSSNSRAA
ncbi:MAG: fatty acid desaturase [Planctomycetes bacterium]|nr:fatty acid desaturase [Planctomycetota bacterium]